MTCDLVNLVHAKAIELYHDITTNFTVWIITSLLFLFVYMHVMITQAEWRGEVTEYALCAIRSDRDQLRPGRYMVTSDGTQRVFGRITSSSDLSSRVIHR